jgi:hypothetical protein
LAAGAIALVTAFNDPSQYRATSTVLTPTPIDSPVTPQITAQAVSNLQGIISSAGFVREVAEETGESELTVRRGLSDERLGLSSVVELRFTHTDPVVVEDVIEVAGTRAMLMLTQGDTQRALAEAQLAEDEYTAADQALQELLTSLGTVDPEADLDVWIGRLVDAQTEPDPSEEPTTPVVPTSTIDQLRERVVELQQDVLSYRTALDERNAAFEDFRDARERLFRIQAISEASPDAYVISPTEAVELSRRLPLARTVIAVSGIAFALAVGLVILLQVVAPRRESEAYSS